MGKNRQKLKQLQDMAIKTTELQPVKIAHKVADFILHHLPHFTKKTVTVAITAYVLVSAAVIFAGTIIHKHDKAVIVNLEAESKQLAVIKAKEQEDQKLGNYVLFLMKMYRSQEPTLQQQMLAQAIVRRTSGIFTSYEERKWMAVLVANESGFNKNAKSPVGAVGLTQVMPQYVNEFASHCGITITDKTDIMDVDTNLTLGACRFKELLLSYEGEVYTALAAYNAGKNAKSLKELQSLANITNMETVNYISKFAHVKSRADIQEQKHEKEIKIPLAAPQQAYLPSTKPFTMATYVTAVAGTLINE